MLVLSTVSYSFPREHTPRRTGHARAQDRPCLAARPSGHLGSLAWPQGGCDDLHHTEQAKHFAWRKSFSEGLRGLTTPHPPHVDGYLLRPRAPWACLRALSAVSAALSAPAFACRPQAGLHQWVTSRMMALLQPCSAVQSCTRAAKQLVRVVAVRHDMCEREGRPCRKLAARWDTKIRFGACIVRE